MQVSKINNNVSFNGKKVRVLRGSRKANNAMTAIEPAPLNKINYGKMFLNFLLGKDENIKKTFPAYTKVRVLKNI